MTRPIDWTAPMSGEMTFANASFASLGINKTTNPKLSFGAFVITLSFGPPPEELSAVMNGLPMANALEQMLISANQAVTSDINNHLFGLMAGDGEEAANGSVDDDVVVGEGDGPEDPIARKVRRSRQWEVFTTANYGNAHLGAIGNQAGVQVDSWAPSVGIERHLSPGLALGFAATFLHSEQRYTGGLGSLSLEGPGLSTYLTYARKNFWNSLLYNFGSYELSSQRNPGFGFPVAHGDTRTYINAVQYNTGWNFRFQDNTLVTGPFAGIDYLHGSVDSYSETGGGAAALAYGTQSYESLVTRVGWSVSKKLSTSFAEITPQARVSYERQNLTNNGTSVSLINAPFTATGGNQSPGQDYLVAGAGVNLAFNDQLSLLLTYQGQFFRENMQSHFGGVRLSYKF
ncbi:MAG: autotransporter outer membrane beta-barrel domain-containing protein [Prosthecobacter sp.]